MDIGGNPGHIRSTARRLRERADDVDGEAARVLRSRELRWESTAAETFRRRLEDRHRDMTGVAREVRDAASSLDRLADTLAERQQLLQRLLDQAGATLEEAQELARRGVGDVVDAAQDLADHADQLIDDGWTAIRSRL